MTMNAHSAVADGVYRHAAATILRADGGVLRGALVGPAGSGKSATLRLLMSHLDRLGRPHTLIGARLDIASVASDHVLLVDASWQLTPEDQALLVERAEDRSAGLVVALRPWSRTETLARLVRLLDQSGPPVILGHLSRSKVTSSLEEAGCATAPSCIDDILELTGSLSWLTFASFAAHDAESRVCDAGHDRLAEMLIDQIAHRVQSLPTELRRAIELLSLGVGPVTPQGETYDWDSLIADGYAEGLLQRNGEPPPIVCRAVRSTTSVQRMVELAPGIAERLARERSGDVDAQAWMVELRDPRIAAALAAHADASRATQPLRARGLYEAAIECGHDRSSLAYGLGRADWALGDLEAMASGLDPVVSDAGHPEHEDIVDAVAAMWTARGAMKTGNGLYHWARPRRALSLAIAATVGIGVGDRQWVLAPDDEGEGPPSMASVALSTVRRGLAQTLTPELDRALAELVIGAETYTASRSDVPLPELPAVIAAVAAINLGRLEVAAHVLSSAEQAGHAGPWARRRLLLWQAWVALHRERSREAPEMLVAALALPHPVSPRDQLLIDVLKVAIARRHGQASDLMVAWRESRHCLLRTRFDLYTFPLLGELAVCATKTGDMALVDGHFGSALTIDQELGSPALWSVHLRWAGIQQAILLDRPEMLAPHAHALLEAAASNKLAAKMARAGRVWTEVMTGVIDAESIEIAANGLATAGLAWDGARLAGHSASRTDDRKIAARLMACARELHPADGNQTPIIEGEKSGTDVEPPANGVLSEREREVALLVLQGKTYNEIGASIFISPRTAEHHIARIRRRLGAVNRSELITRLRVLLHDGIDGKDAGS